MEQVLIKHVNRFVKECKVLSKKVAFKHSRLQHVMCVMICCGLYNMKKQKWGSYDREIN
jgi:hypothetical protein